jgi:hypothetical protein
MTPQNVPARDAFTSAVRAIANLLESDFSQLVDFSWTEALMAHSEIERLPFPQKKSSFNRHFAPLRQQMIALLAESSRRLFKVALANPTQTGNDPDTWTRNQLQPAVSWAVEWIREWYIFACDGQNQSVGHAGSLDFVPKEEASSTLPTAIPPLLASTAWRAPAWLFEISIAVVGIGMGGMKPQHVPNMDSDERLGESHTRLLLKGARRVFLWQLGAVIDTVRDQETAAAGAIRAEAVSTRERRTIKRKGWEQRLKLYEVIQTILSANPSLEGMKFCAELDKRHAVPLLDWLKSKDWQKIFWSAVRKGWMIVGFNLPFDLSRLSRGWRRSRRGGFRLIPSLQLDYKSRTWKPHPYRPEISLDAKDARTTFITRGVPRFRKDEWKNPGRFLDVGTLLFSLFDKHMSLDQWCAEFQRKGYAVQRKLEHEPSGSITQEALRYCRQDVKITQQLLNAAKWEFDLHPLPNLLPDKAYSPASLAKAYMREMNIVEPLNKFKVYR